MPLTLDEGQLDAVFPFALVCDAGLTIERIGPSLRKALHHDPAGVPLLDVFAVERPRGAATARDLCRHPQTPVLLRAHDADLVLRCQPLELPDGRVALLGSLALASETELAPLGLSYSDFAPSDPTPDLLIIKHTLERNMLDLAVLNGDLEESTAQLRATNAALAEAERRYRALVEQQPLVTYIDDLGENARTLYTSDNVVDVTGYSAEQWTAEEDMFFSILHPDDRDRVRGAHVAAVRASGPFKGDFRFVRPDGDVVWVHAEDRPVHDDDGTPLYRLGYLLDITERRKAEDELRDAETRLRTLVESLQVGILLEDEHRRVAQTNDAFCAIFGIPASAGDLVGADCAAAAEQSKELAASPERFLSRIDATLAAGVPVFAEEVEFADGRVYERDYVPIVVDGTPRGHLWGYRDVTPRIEAQREIEEAHDAAVAASRAKSEFLATVSHEIRTPMHGVLGTADLLRRTALTDEQLELVEMLTGSATSLLSLINDMLDLQKAEMGHLELESVPVDVPAVVQSAADVVAAAARTQGLALSVAVDPLIPDDLVGDPGRIRQILVNLAANAVKFTPAGGIAIEALQAELEDDRATVVLAVTDSGIGIPAEHAERVFEPFAQLDATSTTPYEGTGLGLSISRRLAEGMGGTITLESEPGAGTTVMATIRLDRASRPSVEPAAPAGTLPRLAGSVLVVEDSRVNRELALRQLARLGLAATAVESGAAAVEAVGEGRYDVVLMDVRMPGMDGLDATRAIRAREAGAGRPRTPVVGMTANAGPGSRTECLAAGMDEFVTKPLLLDDLAAVLAHWVEPTGEAAGLAADVPSTATATVAATLDGLAAEVGTDAAARITVLWLEELPGRLAELEEATAAGSAERVRAAAHTLASTSALVGAARAGELAEAMENRAVHGALPTPDEATALAAAHDLAAADVRAWSHGAVPR